MFHRSWEVLMRWSGSSTKSLWKRSRLGSKYLFWTLQIWLVMSWCLVNIPGFVTTDTAGYVAGQAQFVCKWLYSVFNYILDSVLCFFAVPARCAVSCVICPVSFPISLQRRFLSTKKTKRNQWNVNVLQFSVDCPDSSPYLRHWHNCISLNPL